MFDIRFQVVPAGLEETTALARLRPREHPGWAPVLTDLQQQLAHWRAAHDEDLAAHAAGQHATEQHAAEQAGDPHPPVDDGPGPGLDAPGWARVAARRRDRARQAWARFPSAALRRWITMRDRSCVFPPCGASALTAEIDHTRAVVDHGLTAPDNLGPACGHDHDLKDQGWTLTQPRPGWFVWTSPTGHTYQRRPQPAVDDLPEPRPPTHPSSTGPGQVADDGPVWDSPPWPRPAETPPPPVGAPEVDPDPPPF